MFNYYKSLINREITQVIRENKSNLIDFYKYIMSLVTFCKEITQVIRENRE